MAGFEEVNYYFRRAARIMDLSPRVEKLLITPFREVKVDMSITLDAGAPKKIWERELERLTRCFVRHIHELIGPQTDIPAPDVGTNAQVMAWIMDEYSRIHGFSPGVATGKPGDLFGSKGREEATGRGVVFALEEFLKDTGGGELRGKRCAIQGFGNVGSWAARFLHEAGARGG